MSALAALTHDCSPGGPEAFQVTGENFKSRPSAAVGASPANSWLVTTIVLHNLCWSPVLTSIDKCSMLFPALPLSEALYLVLTVQLPLSGIPRLVLIVLWLSLQPIAV